MKMSQFPLNLKHFEMLKMMTCYRFAHKGGGGTGRPSLHATGMKETRLAYNPPSLSFDTKSAPCMHQDEVSPNGFNNSSSLLGVFMGP